MFKQFITSTSRKAYTAIIAGLSLMAAAGCIAGDIDDETSLEGEEEPVAEAAMAITWSGHDYLFFLAPLNWEEAQAQCSILGYNLVTINNYTEESWLQTQETIYGGGVWWIGLNDKGFEGIWTWASPSSTYTNWSPGEPNNAGNEDCVTDNVGGGKWNDWLCSGKAKYICERNY